MSKKTTFERLPVGACFAYEAATKHATRRKVDESHTMLVPSTASKRTYRVDDVEARVFEKACPVSFGRRRKRRRTKRSR